MLESIIAVLIILCVAHIRMRLRAYRRFKRDARINFVDNEAVKFLTRVPIVISVPIPASVLVVVSSIDNVSATYLWTALVLVLTSVVWTATVIITNCGAKKQLYRIQSHNKL